MSVLRIRESVSASRTARAAHFRSAARPDQRRRRMVVRPAQLNLACCQASCTLLAPRTEGGVAAPSPVPSHPGTRAPRHERGDFAFLSGDLTLVQRDVFAVGDGGNQVHGPSGDGARAAQGLAVDCDGARVVLREIGVPRRRGRASVIRRLVLQAPTPVIARASAGTARSPPASSRKPAEPGADRPRRPHAVSAPRFRVRHSACSQGQPARAIWRGGRERLVGRGLVGREQPAGADHAEPVLRESPARGSGRPTGVIALRGRSAGPGPGGGAAGVCCGPAGLIAGVARPVSEVRCATPGPAPAGIRCGVLGRGRRARVPCARAPGAGSPVRSRS
ncbi:hypothetical protein ACVW19_005565 [Streptomyces sp. TE5632]